MATGELFEREQASAKRLQGPFPTATEGKEKECGKGGFYKGFSMFFTQTRTCGMLCYFFTHYAAKQRAERLRGCYDGDIIAALFLDLID